jgi:hypothetical protein
VRGRDSLQLRDAGGEGETEQMRGTLGEDGIGLGACERRVATHFTESAEIVALIEVELPEHLVGGAGHGKEGAHGIRPPGLVLGHDPVVQSLGALPRVSSG